MTVARIENSSSDALASIGATGSTPLLLFIPEPMVTPSFREAKPLAQIFTSGNCRARI